MNIKTKLSLGLGLLFLLIILLISISVRFLSALAEDSRNILADNYKTIEYTRHMLLVLEEDMTQEKNVKTFEEGLKKQQNNITEIGEQELTDHLTKEFELLKTKPMDSLIHSGIRKALTDIMLLNMQAIQRKSAVADETAHTATTVISISGGICFILAFILLMNLPGSIVNPIKKLNESIREIAAKNYSHRVQFDSQDEYAELAHSFNKMAQKLDEYNNTNVAKLMMEKKRIETLINNMHDPVIGLDENKEILFVNDEALKITGLKKSMLIGKRASDIAVHHDLMRLLIQGFDASSLPGKKDQKDPIKIFSDGKESYFNKEIISIDHTPTGETQSQHVGDVILLKNITRFKELDVAKTNFIATVSHELKTPISSVLMSLQLLENEKTGQINEAQKQLIESVKEDSRRLLKITGELLNFTQIDTGNVQLTIQPSDPMKMLDYAIEAVRTQADQKGLTIKVQTAPQLPQVKADGEKTAWVIVNLLTNAIRYSPDKAEIRVTIDKILESDHSYLKFSVQDFGNGIEVKYLHKIFDRYFQIPGSHKSGTGLGLAISKEFIEAQGGRIWAESTLGSGSTFYFTLNV